MLPAAKTSRFSLADVVPNCLEALRGRTGRLGLPPVTHAVIVLADGLGLEALEAHRGHARTLSTRLGADPAISAGFPTTTAAALATLTTGEAPGRHGMAGYRALDPARNEVVGQLTLEGLDPATWQRVPTLFERAADVRSVAIASPRHAASAFTRAVLRGAEYRGAASVADRFAAARRELEQPGPVLVYLYIADLDVAGHAHGIASERWVRALEELDAQVAALAAELGPRQGMLVTADHGMVDVPAEAQRIVTPELLAGVRAVAGEPRCLQLHLARDADAEELAARWRGAEGGRAWIGTRAEAVAAGWFGEVDPQVLPRIGDVLVAARGRTAYYLDENDTARRMIGQHGSLTPGEQRIPLLRFGAFAG
jgi:hypothetical protein